MIECFCVSPMFHQARRGYSITAALFHFFYHTIDLPWCIIISLKYVFLSSFTLMLKLVILIVSQDYDRSIVVFFELWCCVSTDAHPKRGGFFYRKLQ